jgi:membrane-associated protease RseP (regulator of RpoE activity)
VEAWLVAVLVLVAYGALVLLLNQVGLFQKISVQSVGPLLIWRTLRFRKFIDWLARPARMWKAFGDFSIAFAFISMVLMVGLLAVSAVRVVGTPAGSVRVEQVIGLPAINPLIPLWYGIFGLSVAILVHEGCHGILSRAESIVVRSVGLLLFVVPIGAFVEPDESQMRKAPLRKRLRIFAAGPASNLVLAAVCAVVFSSAFVGGAKPRDDGAYVVAVFQGSPADVAGLRPNTLITAVQLGNDTEPVPLSSFGEFSQRLLATRPGEQITLQYLTPEKSGTMTFQLGTWPQERLPPGENRTNGYVGVSTEDPGRYLAWAQPGQRIADGCKQTPAYPGTGCVVDSLGTYLLVLPLAGYSPLPPERQWLYEPTGPLGGLGGAYWPVADLFYWLFWLNFMVGVFNVVPMLPLDGGHMYRDGVHALLRRSRRKPRPVAASEPESVPAHPEPEFDDFLGVDASKGDSTRDDVFGRTRDPVERLAHRITVYTSLAMLALIAWPLVWSYFVAGLVG